MQEYVVARKRFDTIAPMTDLDLTLPEFENATIAVAFHDLHTGQEFFINADQPFHPAGTIKVAVMMEVFNQVEKGIFWPDDELPIINLFKSITDESLYSVNPQDDSDTSLYDKIGSTVTIQELTRLMIVRAVISPQTCSSTKSAWFVSMPCSRNWASRAYRWCVVWRITKPSHLE